MEVFTESRETIVVLDGFLMGSSDWSCPAYENDGPRPVTIDLHVRESDDGARSYEVGVVVSGSR